MISQEWIERGEAHVVKTYGRYPLVAVQGKGCRLWDADGKSYLDFLAGVAVNNLGHCHPRVVAALQQQAARLIHCSNYYHIPSQIELAELLCEHSFGDRVFFCNSGAEANEAAMKLVRKYSAENFNNDRFEVITALASFHGRTIGTISATGQDKVKAGFNPLLPGFHYVPFGDVEALRKAITPRICAVMLEPVQGEGGVRVAPPGYLAEVRRICDEHDLLLVFDEVQCGCGRTGTLFAYEQHDVAPDIMTLAKALAGGPPIGAMIATEKVAACFGPGSHGSTFGGNPLMTSAALAAMRTLLEDGVLDNCRAMGEYLRGRLLEFKERFPFISEVRGRGLILGMELTIPGADIVSRALQKGLLINCTANTVLRFVPPLIVTREEIDEAMAILGDVLQEF
ncbi:MAG: acetylornithine transaminase [Syntrophotalea acetylenica]|jgi:acetylornithine aminotransferase|uniref:Acetylornithine aminotransferase n=1 Tax=Syntrophotalea acetylenica TaxID=29542 RepID=A0A1L3GH10_SYNAC|nr:acetylornithine transaminase [Syntrophotalea acetylenica]APG25189.1 acetylornithine aminotransferase [Syntrophotalea acetylenica]APG43258.1 acetylornithine aminotransferase [Syntrophotalea acetylenica]MDD4457573.1 acetylornithine transaminase [Syntrophotalea acetylenica]MDY0261462.1 acetylornithine transaminase [Syntrophotalea acetylenica]